MIVVIPYSTGVRLYSENWQIERVDESGEKYYEPAETTTMRGGVQYNTYMDENDAADIVLAMQSGGLVFTSYDAYRRWVDMLEPLDGDMLLEEPPLPL